MAISAPGIGSNLDINSIVRQLLTVEAQPLTKLAAKEASYQGKLSAYGSLSGALSSFQGAVSGLSTPGKFQTLNASPSDTTVMTATANSEAVAGSYNVNVVQLAQAQTLTTTGHSSKAAAIGTGTITIQFGTISRAGTALGAGVAASGIAAGSLSINGTAIVTGASTNSAKALANQINLATGTTGVTATAQATDTGSLGAFTPIADAATYSLSVGGISIVSNAEVGTDGDDIDTRLTDPVVAGNLRNAGISHTGSASAGTLKFTRADGSNIAIEESGAGASGGFTATVGIGTSQTFTGAVHLSPGNVTIGGDDPSLAGFAAGTMPTDGIYSDTAFSQDPLQSTGSITIDSSNNSLQGIRDAINKANIGVTAAIVSDGSGNPYHLTLTSKRTGESSNMKISVSGDQALQDLLAYDAADTGGQKLTETNAARDTIMTVNGLTVSASTRTVIDAAQGITMVAAKTGTSTLTVSRDTNSVTSAVNGFVKAFNDMNKTLSSLTAYNSETKQGGPLVGDATARSIQFGIREVFSASIPELTGNIKSLPDIGVTFQKDGTLAVDASKLKKAIDNNFTDIAALFSALGTASDSLTGVDGSSAATKAGVYAVNVTRAASQAELTGTVNLNAGPTVITSPTSLNVTLDGTDSSVSLIPGSYTAEQLAAMVQSAINGTSDFSTLGSAVTASINSSGQMVLSSNRYGSASNITITSGSGTTAATLLGTSPASTVGKDVAGSIGGVAAVGSGQFLTGAEGSGADGLKLQITGNATGDRGTVTFSRGYADKLSKLLDTYLGTSGIISGRTAGLNNSIKDIGKSREALNERLLAVEKRYRAQFAALDKVISGLNSTSSFLTQQLQQISNLSKSQ